MSILFSGDFHANSINEIKNLYKDILIKRYGQERYNRIKYQIILGDGKFMWPNNKERDKQNYEILDKRLFPILCVMGEEEPVYGMENLNEADIGIGETVYQINENPFIAYLKRGKVYTIDGIKFLVLGGALSIDKLSLVQNETWWEKEYLTEQEKKDIFKLLETQNTFDFVISHTGPNRINKELFLNNVFISRYKFFDKMAMINDEIEGRIRFHAWWCGHFHFENYFYDRKKKQSYQYLYKSTRIIEKLDGKFVVYKGRGKAEWEYKEEKNVNTFFR